MLLEIIGLGKRGGKRSPEVKVTLEALEDEGVSPGEPRGVGRGEKSQVWGRRRGESTECACILNGRHLVC